MWVEFSRVGLSKLEALTEFKQDHQVSLLGHIIHMQCARLRYAFLKHLQSVHGC